MKSALLLAFASVVFASTSPAFAAGSVEAADVAILVPLKTRDGSAAKAPFLSAKEALPLDVFPGASVDLSPVNADHTKAELFERLQVVGVRLDPCAKDHSPDACASEIRLVWQPVLKDGTTADVGVHTFYPVSVKELKALAKSWNELRNARGTDSWTKLLARDSMSDSSTAAAKFRASLLPYVSAKRMKKVAWMTHIFPLEWEFKSGSVKDGKFLSTFPVLGSGNDSQRFSKWVENGKAITHYSTKEMMEPSVMIYIVSPAYAEMALSRDEKKAFYDVFERIQDPRRTKVGETDCGTCHLTNSVKNILGVHLGIEKADVLTTPNTFRSFGFEGADNREVIAPRVRMEAEISAAQLSAEEV